MTVTSVDDVIVADMTKFVTSSLSVVGRRRLSTVEHRVGRQPRRVEVGVVGGHVIGGHVVAAAGARRGDAHLDLVVPLQPEQTAHHDRHVPSVWTADAGDVQLAVARRRMTTVSWLILCARHRRPVRRSGAHFPRCQHIHR